ncbi:MAG: hypothetical protein IJU99_00535 [Lachnospiraceae bacterium]|nr:hypothetical protein [Lachnospiraceae bacterium]
MSVVKGTKSRKARTDSFMRCASCGRLFYFPGNINGETVQCPHCLHNH